MVPGGKTMPGGVVLNSVDVVVELSTGLLLEVVVTVVVMAFAAVGSVAGCAGTSTSK
jgi:hypothetical protein